ncbi:armadillo-type protein [Xylariales sp. PMI_506]|nr:armadillo-type protein [Xylariales sp. PMI_506]
MGPSEVEAIFKSSNQLTTAESEEDEILLPDAEISQRTAVLLPVLSAVRTLLDSGSEDLDIVAQKIGDGSRDATWRIPLGRSGIVEFFVELFKEDDLKSTTILQALRIVGNSCADTDENRERVINSDSLPRIIKLLGNDNVIIFVTSVLFNVCVDYEPAQVAAYKANLNPELINIISGPRLSAAEPAMSIICKLLALVAGQEPEANLVHPATPSVLLTLATASDSPVEFEDFLGQISVAVTYLSNPLFQDLFLQTASTLPVLLRAFSMCCTGFKSDELDPDEADQLGKVQSVFTQALADLSANPLFAPACTVGGQETQTLQQWIGSPSSQLQSAACLILGNIARSDEVCISFVQDLAIHQPLISILADVTNTDAQLLHSTLSFLKNLAIPTVNKPILGDAGLFEPNLLPRLWALDSQIQVQFAAVSLARLLVVSCATNVKKVCRSEPSELRALIDLFQRSDQEPTKTEAARTVVAVLRVLHSSQSDPHSLPKSMLPAQVSSEEAIEGFYHSHTALADTLVYLGTQIKFPVLRSDLWFVLALVSRSPSGVRIVLQCLQNEELLKALTKAVVEAEDSAGGGDNLTVLPQTISASEETENPITVAREGLQGLNLGPQAVDPAQKLSMTRVDRENGLVLIAEVLQRCPETPISEKLKEILKAGGDIVISQQRLSNDKILPGSAK